MSSKKLTKAAWQEDVLSLLEYISNGGTSCQARASELIEQHDKLEQVAQRKRVSRNKGKLMHLICKEKKVFMYSDELDEISKALKNLVNLVESRKE